MVEIIRAGGIPYYKSQNGLIMMLFMVPSDPNFGGDKPQIAKGLVDPGERPEDGGIREAVEELGLIKENILNSFLGFKREQETKKGLSKFYVYGMAIKDNQYFTEPHWETKETVWLSEKEISTQLRRDHTIPVYSVIRTINKRGD